MVSSLVYRAWAQAIQASPLPVAKVEQFHVMKKVETKNMSL